MKEIFVSENLEIVNNLDAVLMTIETLADKDLSDKVKTIYQEMAKTHSVIPFVVFTNKRETFSPEATVGKGDFTLLMLNFNTRELLAHIWVDVVKKTLTRVVTEA